MNDYTLPLGYRISENCNTSSSTYLVYRGEILLVQLYTYDEALRWAVKHAQNMGGVSVDVVGDVTSSARGSGARYNEGKTPFDLIPLSTLKDAADVFGYGKEKYAAWNWAKGMDWSKPYACMMRHMDAWYRGEENDPESGLPHLGHAMCNMIMLSHYAKYFKEGDDRPPKEMFKENATEDAYNHWADDLTATCRRIKQDMDNEEVFKAEVGKEVIPPYEPMPEVRGPDELDRPTK